MAVAGISSLDCHRLLLLLLLIFLGGVIPQGKTESPASSEKSPSAKECRVHIDAALEKYWEQQPPNEDKGETDQSNANVPINEHLTQEETREHEKHLSEETDEDDLTDTNEEERNDDDDDDETEEEEDAPVVTGGEATEEEEQETEDEEHEHEEGEEEEEGQEDEETEEQEEDEEVAEDFKEEVEEKAEVDKEEEEEEEKHQEEDEEEEEMEESKPEVQEEEEEEEESEMPEETVEEEEEEAEETEQEERGESEEKEEIAEPEEEDEDEEEEEEEGTKSEEEEYHSKSEEEQPLENQKEQEQPLEAEGVDDSESLKKSDEGDQGDTWKEESAQEEADDQSDLAGAGMEHELPEQEPQAEQTEAEEGEEAPKETPVEEEEEEEEEEEGEEEEIFIAEEEEEEEEEEDFFTPSPGKFRSRDHIDRILGLDDVGTTEDKEQEKFEKSILNEIRKTYETAIKPLELTYKYRDISTRLLGDAEIFGKPMVLFLGPWSSGKTTIMNYLFGTERTPAALKTGPSPTDKGFTIVTYGEQRQVVSGTELAADWTYSSVQKFGQAFLDHFRGIRMNHRILQKITFVDTPGITENRKHQERGYPFNDALQWFIDRADAIYVVFDPTKLDIGVEMESVLDQLKGREAQIRFILNKADTIRRSDVMRIVGQLFWNLSPLMGRTEAPIIYAVSLMTKPFHPGAPSKFLLDQEKNFLYDLRETMDKRVENKILYARRHAVRVRNHAKMIDCYLATYYKQKSIFSSKKKVAQLIADNPTQYHIYEGLSTMTNISRYDLPDPVIYREFFRVHPLYDFQSLSSTCSYFRGCPLDKLDYAIAYDLPELLGKYKNIGNGDASKKDEGR